MHILQIISIGAIIYKDAVFPNYNNIGKEQAIYFNIINILNINWHYNFISKN